MDCMTKGSLKTARGLVDARAIEFRVLGPLEARVGARTLALGGPNQRALLAVLLLHANEVVSSDRLIDELWGGEPPSTSGTALHVHVSQLRKVLAADPELLVTRAPGYVIALEPKQLDLTRFERLTAEGIRALEDGDPSSAAADLRAALELWRGPPLADLAYEPFAQVPILRLEELRLVALEARIDAELALGRQAELVVELEGLVAAEPLRERPRSQLMLALYRSGRQIEALEAYQVARRELVEQLGIEPSERLQRLQRSILRHDPELEVVPASERAILAVPATNDSVDRLIDVAEPLARPTRALVLGRLVAAEADLVEASAQLLERRSRLLESGVSARAATFVSHTPARDIVRLATQLEVDLVLLEAPIAAFAKASLPEPLAGVLAEAPCDVGLFLARPARAGPVIVPFGGGKNDWAAIEIGAGIARSEQSVLRLVGIRGRRGGRDASRLLADASLAVQYALGIAAEPLLVSSGPDGLLAASEGASLIVAGLSDRWRGKGLGETRAALARESPTAILFVRAGVRPSALAPRESATRYTWSLGGPG
jgi:DNA-binding SARP family transcriptional activator